MNSYLFLLLHLQSTYDNVAISSVSYGDVQIWHESLQANVLWLESILSGDFI